MTVTAWTRNLGRWRRQKKANLAQPLGRPGQLDARSPLYHGVRFLGPV